MAYQEYKAYKESMKADPMMDAMSKPLGGEPLPSLSKTPGGSDLPEMVTLHRSVSELEMKILSKTKKLAFKYGQMEVKQFWKTEEGLNNFNKSGFGGEYNVEITVPKSLIGNGRPLNTAVQVDESFGPTVTIEGQEHLNIVNRYIQNIKITPVKK